MTHEDPKTYQNWLPVKLIKKEEELFLEWIYLSAVYFTKPFFDETITECNQFNSLPKNQIRKRQTPLTFALEVAKSIQSIKPSLFIFHTSRCGSTLCTQLLSLNDENIVIAEFELIDAILRINERNNNVSESLRYNLLKSIIAIVGQIRTEKQQRLIIKLDSWHFTYFNDIKELYPEAKCMMLYRNPNAILSSIQKLPGLQFIPEIISPKIYAIEDFTFNNYSNNEYINKVLFRMYQIIEEISTIDKNVVALDYDKGILQIILEVYELLGIPAELVN